MSLIRALVLQGVIGMLFATCASAGSIARIEEIRTLQDPLLVISNGPIGLDRLTSGRSGLR